MQPSARLFLLTVTTTICIGCDQATKKMAQFALKGGEAKSYIGNLFRLEYAENSGAFLGLGSTLPEWARFALLTVISSFVLVGLAIYLCLQRRLSPVAVFGYSLILAGGVSNMIDRIFVGFVVDFMNLGIGALRTGIFNVADVAIMLGLLLVLTTYYFPQNRALAPPSA